MLEESPDILPTTKHHKDVPPKPKSNSKILFIILGVIITIFVLSSSQRHRIFQIISNVITPEKTLYNYFMIIAIGTIINVVGLSDMIFNIIFTYILKDYLVCILLIVIYQTLAKVIIFKITRSFLRERIVSALESYQYFYAFMILAKIRRIKTLFALRFSCLPGVLTNYGLPILGYGFFEYIGVSFLASIMFALTECSIALSVTSYQDIHSGSHAGNDKAYLMYIPIIVGALGLMFLVLLYLHTKQLINRILAKYDIEEIKQKLKNAEASDSGVLDVVIDDKDDQEEQLMISIDDGNISRVNESFE